MDGPSGLRLDTVGHAPSRHNHRRHRGAVLFLFFCGRDLSMIREIRIVIKMMTGAAGARTVERRGSNVRRGLGMEGGLGRHPENLSSLELGDRLGPGIDVQLVVDAPDVGPHRRDADVQFRRDFLVAKTPGQQFEHALLARREFA